MAVWLVLWAAGWLWTAYVWLWSAFGKEVVTVGYGDLILKRDILGCGRRRVFPVSEVSNLRARDLRGAAPQRRSGPQSLFDLSGGVIAFDSGGQTHRFGIQLGDNEAQEVVARLAEHLPIPRPEPR
jgi:hypothetical protein